MLTANQLLQYQIFGFTAMKAVFTLDELRTIDIEFNRGLARALDDTERRGIRRQLNWSNLGRETPFLASLLEDVRFLRSAEQIFGGEVVGRTCNSNSFDSDRTEWHPDTYNLARRGVKFAFYLQPLDGNTGALRFMPGSHKNPLHSEIKRITLKHSNEGVIDASGIEIDEMPAHIAASDRGDVIVFDSRVWHASWGGGTDRRMCSVNYFAVPTTPEEEASMLEIKEAEAALVEAFPLLVRPQHWLANPQNSQVRRRWIDFLERWGIIASETQDAARSALR